MTTMTTLETKTTLNNVGPFKTAPTPNTAARPDGLVILTLRVGEQYYALPINDIVEVAAMVEIVRVAGQPPEVLGMVNRHGVPLVLLDLKTVFHRESKDQQPARSKIDVNTLFAVACPDFAAQQQGHHETASTHYIGLIADEIQQVEYTTGMSEVSLLAPSTPRYIRGIVNHKSRLIQVIEISSLMAAYVPAYKAGT